MISFLRQSQHVSILKLNAKQQQFIIKYHTKYLMTLNQNCLQIIDNILSTMVTTLSRIAYLIPPHHLKKMTIQLSSSLSQLNQLQKLKEKEKEIVNNLSQFMSQIQQKVSSLLSIPQHNRYQTNSYQNNYRHKSLFAPSQNKNQLPLMSMKWRQVLKHNAQRDNFEGDTNIDVDGIALLTSTIPQIQSSIDRINQSQVFRRTAKSKERYIFLDQGAFQKQVSEEKDCQQQLFSKTYHSNRFNKSFKIQRLI